jgi:ethanolamine ammonia-lyase small subunit
MKLDDATLDAIVAGVLARLATEAPVAAPATSAPSAPCGGEAGHACTATPRPVHAVESPVYEAMLPRLVALTSSQVAVGRAGNRFRTDLYLQAREGHADARDAVHSEVDPAWATRHGLTPLQTRCRDRHEHLLYPNHGRRLDDASRGLVERRAGSRPDVVLVVGDGLSANAVTVNGSDTLEALRAALAAAGLRTGAESYFVKFARIGVADEIGVITGARASVMLVGERPGLGAGDSLSLYLAVNPQARSGQRREELHLQRASHRDRPHEAAQQATRFCSGASRGA